jgi:GNAT superfamily N-acetyltransferase
VRAGLQSAGRRIVDGLGAWRVVRTWEQVLANAGRPVPMTGATALTTRQATLQDAGLLWHWRNDPATRAASRFSAQVPWVDHLRWLATSLGRADRMLLMVEDADGPVGTARWDLVREADDEPEARRDWEVSIIVAPQRRGQSLARPLLLAAEAALSENMSGHLRGNGPEVTQPGVAGVWTYLAVVHTDNLTSMRLFETSGYVPDLPPDPQGFMRFRKAAQVT